MGTIRYCPTCSMDVDAVGGRCSRGHRLPPGSIGELRAEIDRTFENAMAEVASLLGTRTQTPPPPQSAPPPPPPPAAGPMPPPPAPRATIWSKLATDFQADPASSDPIAAFAPSPRMDWGPERPSLRAVRTLWRRPSEVSV